MWVPDVIEPFSEQGDERRRAPRYQALIGVKLRRTGESWFAGQLSDLSESGFRLHSFVKLQPGVTLWVMFPGFEARRAAVVWASPSEAGCTFDAPLHKAILEHIVRMGK